MGAVTVATSMAGRGTDIKLGPGVAELGGLIVIGTEHEWRSRRIDCKLEVAPAARAIQAGLNFFVPLEDDVIKKFGPSWVHDLYQDYQVEDISKPILLRPRKYRNLVRKAQEASDSASRSARRQTLEYAESVSIQRQMVHQRKRWLARWESI